MKEFVSAVVETVEEDERASKIAALVAEGKSEADAEMEVDRGRPIKFKIDGRELHAFRPHEGQLAFMLATLGRGQSKEGRFSAILNIMFESLREDDKDWLEGRLLTGNPRTMLKMSVIEGVFEFLMEQWFRDDLPEGGAPVSDSV